MSRGYREESEDDDRFRIRLKKERKSSGSGTRSPSFFQVVQGVCRAGKPTGGRALSNGKGAHRNQKGKGTFTRNAARNFQRVVVKTRVVKNCFGAKGVRALKLHVSYLTRPGVGLEGPERGRSYDENGPLEKRELDLWVEKIAKDRHHFRFIVSPEKGRELELTGYTKELVRAMEKDLGTSLDYVAVNHYNTDNPHVHLIVRGRNDRGANLVLGRDYIASGVRNRAREIATSRLGRRTELEIQDGLVAEIKLERFTGIDRELILSQERSPAREVDLRAPPGRENSIAAFHRSVKKQRVKELERLGLAQEKEPGIWRLDGEAERVLRELGLQNDIIKTMHKSLGREGDRELVIFDPTDPMQRELKGEVLDRGVADELSDRGYLVVSGSDHRIYYVGLSRFAEVEGREALPGSLVRISASRHELELTDLDGEILGLSRQGGGIYRDGVELETRGAGRLSPGCDLDSTAEMRMKRLKVLERNGLAEELSKGNWRVPDDLPDRMRELALKKGLSREVRVILEAPSRARELAQTPEKRLQPERDLTR